MDSLVWASFEKPIACLFGGAGLACQLCWPLLSKKRAMLCVQMGIGANYAVHYALLGAWSGVGICLLGATQTLVALRVGERPGLKQLGYFFLPAAAVVSIGTWNGAQSICAFLAFSLVMLARMQADMIRLRTLMLAAAPFGISHDIFAGATPALAGACISAATSAGGFLREIRRRNQAPMDGARSAAK